jgi:shikimate dehydrogenase
MSDTNMSYKNKVGLIGYPVEHSVSPAMHNAAFESLGLNDWHYELLLTERDAVEARIRTLVADGYVGANVTVPHKQAVMPFLDSLSMAARGIGAVNTIVLDDGRLEGHNTDSAGFILDLQAHGVEVHGQRVLVLGAGGSARAVVLGLANGGATVTVIARREDAAWQLREDVRKGVSRQLQVEVQPQSVLGKIVPTVDLIVNCTPVGMSPKVDESPLGDEIEIPHTCTLYDLVYRPAKTKLMRQAEAAGATVIGGLGMLIYQGALAFELWTGQEAPVDVMREAAEKALG